MKLKKLFIAMAALFTSASCGGQQQQAATEAASTQGNTSKKALVVFFSHAGDNYAVGNIPVGNTTIVADYITELTGADQFEIVTHKYDGMAY